VSIVEGHSGCYYSSLLAAFSELDHCFGTALAMPEPGYASVHQIHSTRVIEPGEPGDADALVTREKGLRVAARSADCVPILIYDPVERAVAAVHSGWRGTVSNIAAAAVAELGRRYGSRPAALHVAIGPAIGVCCFEVGPEVAQEFARLFPERTDLATRTHIDLAEAVRRQLAAAGVPDAQIDRGAPCTCCSGGTFHSWRRTHSPTGRNFSVIGLR
jgi:YfiH family protein